MKTVETKMKFESVLWNNSKFEMIYISLVPICWINKISQYGLFLKQTDGKLKRKLKGNSRWQLEISQIPILSLECNIQKIILLFRITLNFTFTLKKKKFRPTWPVVLCIDIFFHECIIFFYFFLYKSCPNNK